MNWWNKNVFSWRPKEEVQTARRLAECCRKWGLRQETSDGRLTVCTFSRCYTIQECDRQTGGRSQETAISHIELWIGAIKTELAIHLWNVIHWIIDRFMTSTETRMTFLRQGHHDPTVCLFCLSSVCLSAVPCVTVDCNNLPCHLKFQTDFALSLLSVESSVHSNHYHYIYSVALEISPDQIILMCYLAIRAFHRHVELDNNIFIVLNFLYNRCLKSCASSMPRYCNIRVHCCKTLNFGVIAFCDYYK